MKGAKKLTKNLPVMFEDIATHRHILGSQIIAAGITHLPDGSKVNPKAYYSMPTGDKQVNHARKIDKVYKKSGEQGVRNYVNGVFDLAKGVTEMGSVKLVSVGRSIKGLFGTYNVRNS